MRKINDGGPAFPVNDHGASNLVGSAAIDGITDPAERDRVYIAAVAKAMSGMTLRDYFAVHVDISDFDPSEHVFAMRSARATYTDQPASMVELVDAVADLKVLQADALIRRLARGDV